MSVAFAVAPRHTSGTDCRCFAQLTFWSLKVIHMRGVNVFSISHRAAVNSWNTKNSLAELDPLDSTLLPPWQHRTLRKARESDGDSSIPCECGAAAVPLAATPSTGAACWGDGACGAPGSNITRIYCLSWGPSLAGGSTLVNSGRKHLEQ